MKQIKRQKGKTKPLKPPCDCGHRSRGWSERDFDERVLHRGAKVEFEHTCDEELAERIAMDHLVEGKNYYELLEEMEKKLIPYKKLVPKTGVTKNCKLLNHKKIGNPVMNRKPERPRRKPSRFDDLELI